MRVLGVDPGTVATGWGIVDQVGERLRFVAGGVVRPKGELPQRIAAIQQQLIAVIAAHSPNAMSLEKSFVGENIQTAFRLGEARGAILVAAALADIAIAEYSPAEIKLSVAGGGRATKEQMQRMVAHLLGTDPDMPVDQADAVGAAICHIHSRRFADLVDVEHAVGGRGRGRSWRSGGRR